MMASSPRAPTSNEIADGLNFSDAFHFLTEHQPYKWQSRLFEELRLGRIPRAVDIPTGVGKTSVIALWLLARASGGNLPRRLVYVVDRRAIVDQATSVSQQIAEALGPDRDGIASTLRRALRIPDGRMLPVSTLRGRLADNRAWLENPTANAIVVGTIDMIGSRLLFQGYGVSRRMRPFHAALLGADALIALDEAHISPAFDALITSLTTDVGLRAPEPVPPLHVLSLSATAKDYSGNVFRLTQAEADEPNVAQRLDAPKELRRGLTPRALLYHALAERAVQLATNSERVLVYCDSRETATRVADEIEKAHPQSVELVVGARRGRERQRLANSAVYARFERSEDGGKGPAFLVATSAGEVGVDLDADHLICDLVQLERMIQRFGRVNRAGRATAAQIDILIDAEFESLLSNGTTAIAVPPGISQSDALFQEVIRATNKGLRVLACAEDKKFGEIRKRLEKACATGKTQQRSTDAPRVRCIGRGDVMPNDLDVDVILCDFESLESVQPEAASRRISIRVLVDEDVAILLRCIETLERLPARNGAHCASPRALQTLLASDPRAAVAASSSEPLRPHLSRAIVEAWSMTTLGTHTGRPHPDPWLRGWTNDQPQTRIAWREFLPCRDESATHSKEVENFFDAAPVHLNEILDAETRLVLNVLIDRAVAVRQCMTNSDTAVAAIVLNDDNSFRNIVRLGDLARLKVLKDSYGKAERDAMFKTLARATVIVNRRLGGLNAWGLLDKSAVSETVQTLDAGWTDEELAAIGYRVVERQADEQWEDGDWRATFTFALGTSDAADAKNTYVVQQLRRQAITISGNLAVARFDQSLSEHLEWAANEAKAMTQALLPEFYARVVEIAAELHDLGKAREAWQAFAGNSDGRAPLAKFKARPAPSRLKIGAYTYRHEFGSLGDAESHGALHDLRDESRDLVLHLIGAHHGRCRPEIDPVDPLLAPSSCRARAKEAALRFSRLQRHWTPWGLAWWEAVLQGADWRASQQLDDKVSS